MDANSPSPGWTPYLYVWPLLRFAEDEAEDCNMNVSAWPLCTLAKQFTAFALEHKPVERIATQSNAFWYVLSLVVCPANYKRSFAILPIAAWAS